MSGGEGTLGATDSGDRELRGAADGERIGLPVLLLVTKPLAGPWVVANERTFVVVRHVGDRRLAYQGRERFVAERIAERVNGWELARDFPPVSYPKRGSST